MRQNSIELRTLWFMGAKTRLCSEFIDGAVSDLLEPGGTILDLCTGTAAVGRFLSTRYRILANDVQNFSSVVASAHLEGDDAWFSAIEYLDPREDLGRAFESNLRLVTRLAPEALTTEDSLLDQVERELGVSDGPQTGAADRYRQFVAATPLPQVEPGGSPLFQPLTSAMPGLISQRRRDPTIEPAVLMTCYYTNVYLGLRQAMVIDSLRHAIAQIPETDPFARRKRTFYLAALLHAVSVSTSGTSHFAQPRSLEKDSELLAVVRRRRIDVEEGFYLALDAIRRELGESPRLGGNRVFGLPLDDLLAEGGPLADEKVDLVYLDPPYTADNYSRFYHLLETLVDYDYPELELRGGELTRGRYSLREHRFRSDFCKAGEVEGAFNRVAADCRRLGARLLISYSTDAGLMTKRWSRAGEEKPASRFRDMMRQYYPQVEFREKNLMHSGQGDSNRSVRELLILCEG
ncbi:MAG TPA: hypothetical protein EYN00_07705 [Planctomycetes bacterium]|nr:hypothetical protein [Planctomycetota bacterium]